VAPEATTEVGLWWCWPEGKWQKLLPGVYLTVTGKPTAEQRLVAARLYAGGSAPSPARPPSGCIGSDRPVRTIST
jgi:hypothetical protein